MIDVAAELAETVRTLRLRASIYSTTRHALSEAYGKAAAVLAAVRVCRCRKCDREFFASRSNMEYCSPACRSAQMSKEYRDRKRAAGLRVAWVTAEATKAGGAG